MPELGRLKKKNRTAPSLRLEASPGYTVSLKSLSKTLKTKRGSRRAMEIV